MGFNRSYVPENESRIGRRLMEFIKNEVQGGGHGTHRKEYERQVDSMNSLGLIYVCVFNCSQKKGQDRSRAEKIMAKNFPTRMRDNNVQIPKAVQSPSIMNNNENETIEQSKILKQYLKNKRLSNILEYYN